MHQDHQGEKQTWTNERVELLKQMWTEGLSASNIAGRLGEGITRNAVIGKVHRLGLSGRATPARAANPNPRPRRPRQPSTPGAPSRATLMPTAGATALKPQVCERRAPRPEPEPVPEPLHLVNIPKSERLSLLMLNEKTCRWPIGEPGTEDFFFCGMAPQDSQPYCEYHTRMAYQPLHERRRVKRA